MKASKPMNPLVLQKLEWPKLVQNLAVHCQTEEGRDKCLGLLPNLGQGAIEESWDNTLPLRELTSKGYKAPIGDLPNLQLILKAAALGQILGGEDIRDVNIVLESTRTVMGFLKDFSDKCSTLKKFSARLYAIPGLADKISRAVTPNGKLKDDASEELQKIRRQKIGLRKKIEDRLVQLLHKHDIEQYIQDDFFTVRSERYVVPMKLDGRGRVKGSIIDTSDSGQTLYIELVEISPLNDQKQELDLAEKLEIIRIFRELSELIGRHADDIRNNNEELIALDVVTAKAKLAVDQDAGSVKLTGSSAISLVDARHPLIRLANGNPAVGNTIDIQDGKSVLIISGPNAGGKTIVLKTVGLLHLMARAGLLIPAHESSRLRLFDNIYLEMGDAQDLSANLSTFTGHLMGLRPILENATSKDLILLDELAVGTDPQTGSAIAQCILEEFADKRCSTFVTTHYESLKGLAINDKRFRNGSMEFSLDNLKPTYKLILDVPGQSYGIEVAEQLGFPKHLIARAQELRGTSVSTLDEAVNQLMSARDDARKSDVSLKEEKLKAEEERARWKHECEQMEIQRQKISQKLSTKYDEKISVLRTELDELVRKLKKAYKDAPNREEILEVRHQAESKMKGLENFVSELGSNYKVNSNLPGRAVEFSELKIGQNVYVIPLKNDGAVIKLGDANEPVEVEVGMIKLRVNLQDLRIVSGSGGGKKPTVSKTGAPKKYNLGANKPKPKGGTEDLNIGFVLPTHTNSADLRGLDKDQAINSTWDFIDRAMMRGESAVIIIHGHGTGALLQTVRDALEHSCPYEVGYRPGEDQEGGNGVTVVEFK